MDVYVVPTGSGRYELYCEPGDDAPSPAPEGASGLWRRLHEKFSLVLAAVESEPDPAAPGSTVPPDRAGLMSRLRTRGLRWLAERVAEQRLLWRLRGHHTVRAFFPAVIDGTRALAIIRGSLKADGDRHRRWLIVDTVGLLFSLVLIPLPGPNVVGYFFTFRVVGHFLAVRGARQGLRHVTWALEPSAPLGDLAGLEHLPAEERAVRLRAIAGQLGLVRLARFFERTAAETA
jgi:Mitochondrial K+-H+ exchange-related